MLAYSGPQIHRCQVDSVRFAWTHCGRASSTAAEREREFRNLAGFVGGVSYGAVLVFPGEQLLCADSCVSVCDRVCRFVCAGGGGAVADAAAAAILVFVRRTNSSFATHAALVRRVIGHAQRRLLATRRSVYVVADVGPAVGLPTLQGLVPPASGSVHVAVYSGAKPLFSPISCVVVALHSPLPRVLQRL